MTVIYRPTIRCDGCGGTYGELGYENAVMARVCAYADGWRFPSRLKLNGSKSVETNDVCPECLPEWSPRPSRQPGTPMRQDWL